MLNDQKNIEEWTAHIPSILGWFLIEQNTYIYLYTKWKLQRKGIALILHLFPR